MVNNETIVALATPPGTGALALIRISGEETFAIAEKIIKEKSFLSAPERYIKKYSIIDREHNRIVDEVMAIKYKGPRSYTGEDSLEIISHGGYYTVTKIIEQTVSAGARIANRGEFSRRAFYNGKMDLLRAESIRAIIESRSEQEYSTAIRSYLEESGKISAWESAIQQELVFLEAEIEFGEEEEIPKRDCAATEKLINEIQEELSRAKAIKEIKKGFRITIAGPPNAGKSTLFNYLVGYTRTIVHEDPGTTRDTVSESIKIAGVDALLCDTAGIRKTNNPVESEGIRRSGEAINSANLLIWITDGSEPLEANEGETVTSIADSETLFVINKIDKSEESQKKRFFDSLNKKVIRASLRSGKNCDLLVDEVCSRITALNSKWKQPDILINERQISLVEKMAGELSLARSSWNRSEIAAHYMRDALKRVEEISGKIDNEEIINAIFDNFCIGK